MFIYLYSLNVFNDFVMLVKSDKISWISYPLMWNQFFGLLLLIMIFVVLCFNYKNCNYHNVKDGHCDGFHWFLLNTRCIIEIFLGVSFLPFFYMQSNTSSLWYIIYNSLQIYLLIFFSYGYGNLLFYAVRCISHIYTDFFVKLKAEVWNFELQRIPFFSCIQIYKI
jgi:hypothetical protein